MVVLDHGAVAAAAITQRYLSAAVAAASVSPPPPATTAVSVGSSSSSYLMQTSSPYVRPLNDEVRKPASQLFPLALALAPAPAAWTVDCRLKIHGSSVQSVWIRLTLSSLLFQRSAVFLSTFPWKFSACPARSLPLYSSPSVKPRMVAKDYVSLSPPVSAPVRCQEQSISPANPSV